MAAWMELVKADTRLVTSDALPDPQLKDHIPKLLAAMIESFRSGTPAVEEARSSAAKHGEQRWQQGYRLRELLLEIFWLRTALFREVAAFAAGHSDELLLCSEVCALTDKFLNDLESRSVERFVEAKEAELRKSDHEKLRLIRTVSHELRNMLNSVGLASSLLDSGGKESVGHMQRNLRQNTTHMTSVLDDLLNLATILSRGSPIKPIFFSPARLLTLLNASFHRMAESRGIRFTSSVDDSLTEVCTDELKVRQIIENLVSSAIKYTFEGEVRVRCESEGERSFAIFVEDTGVGIAKADRELVFSEFYQVEPESPIRGLGLGLSIVAGLVERLNGSIELESEPNKGSRFKVVLPRVSLPPKPPG